MDNDIEYSEYDFSDLGDSELFTSSDPEAQMEMASNSSSDPSVDYSSYLEDIISDIESLIGYYDDDVSLADIHKDITITNFLILFFIVLFAGNKLINRIRGL